MCRPRVTPFPPPHTDTAAIFTNTTNFSKADRSNAVTAVTIGLGLSAPLVACIYRVGSFGENHLSDYFVQLTTTSFF